MAWKCAQPHFVLCHTPRLTWTPGLGVSLGVWHRTKWGHIGGTAHSKAAHIPGPKPVPPPFPCRYNLCTYSMLNCVYPGGGCDCPAGKLRDVEVMCQENEEAGGAVVRKILDILYQVTGFSFLLSFSETGFICIAAKLAKVDPP